MNVQDVIDLAVGSELRALSLKKDTDAIVGFINLGLVELYKRFRLETKSIVLTLGDDTSPNYVSDTEYVMPEDYMAALAVYGEVAVGSTKSIKELSINNIEEVDSVFTIGYNKIQIPLFLDGERVEIMYSASPVFLAAAELTATVPIPPQLLESLLHYIGFRGHGSIEANINTENNTHLMRFEASVARVKALGSYGHEDLSTISRLYNKGFV